MSMHVEVELLCKCVPLDLFLLHVFFPLLVCHSGKFVQLCACVLRSSKAGWRLLSL